MWEGKTIGVVLPTYNERDSIRQCVLDFAQDQAVDFIIVVNNNAAHGTSDEITETPAIEVLEPGQGYGAAIKRGVAEAKSLGCEFVVLCEPDGTFRPSDLAKLLPFLHDVPVVLGSRTVNSFIWDGANMGLFLKWGNWFVAKLIEVLFNTSYLSDVGCTFRVFHISVWDETCSIATTDGSAFGLELLMATVRRRVPFVQVPVNYMPRVGTSSVTGDFRQAMSLGLLMIGKVLTARLHRRPPGAFVMPTLEAKG